MQSRLRNGSLLFVASLLWISPMFAAARKPQQPTAKEAGNALPLYRSGILVRETAPRPEDGERPEIRSRQNDGSLLVSAPWARWCKWSI